MMRRLATVTCWSGLFCGHDEEHSRSRRQTHVTQVPDRSYVAHAAIVLRTRVLSCLFPNAQRPPYTPMPPGAVPDGTAIQWAHATNMPFDRFRQPCRIG